VGVLITEDEAGEDIKIIAVPDKKVDPIYGAWENIKDVPQPMLSKIKHFFENYKSLEAGKWVKVKEYKDKTEAETLIQKARKIKS
jgi:inorganic pyrophosphatase